MTADPYTVSGFWAPKECGVTTALLPLEGQEIRVTGEIQWDEDENSVGSGARANQTRQCFRRIEHGMVLLGAWLDGTVETTTRWSLPDDVPKIHAVRCEFLSEKIAPASTFVRARGCACPELLVEPTPVAVIPRDRFRAPA